MRPLIRSRLINAAEDALDALPRDASDRVIAEALADYYIQSQAAFQPHHWHLLVIDDRPRWHDWTYKNCFGISTRDRFRAHRWIVDELLDGHKPGMCEGYRKPDGGGKGSLAEIREHLTTRGWIVWNPAPPRPTRMSQRTYWENNVPTHAEKLDGLPPTASDREIASAFADYYINIGGPYWHFVLLNDRPRFHDWTHKNCFGISTRDRDRAHRWLVDELMDGHTPFTAMGRRKGGGGGNGNLAQAREKLRTQGYVLFAPGQS